MCFFFVFFFFKQKTAYEIKECDWSSDVCSSDLRGFRVDHGDSAPRVGSGDYGAALLQVADDVAHVLLRGGHLDPHNGLQQHNAGLAEGFGEGVAGGHADGHFAGIGFLDFPAQQGDQIGRASCRERV